MCDHQLDVATVEFEAEPKSITNIYYDCLERIFDFLDLESLMNVAGTCKRLQIAAAAKFADDHGHARVRLHHDWAHNNIDYIHDQTKTSIDVRRLKFCLTFLRCFGAKILNLNVDSVMSMGNHHQYVGRYINRYCADTLISIRFSGGISFSSEIFAKPFKAVRKLVLDGCKLSDQFPNFVHWFPNLHHLTLMGPISIDVSAIAVSFPYLEHLTIQLNENSSNLCTTENAIKILRANQQLQSLEIFLFGKFDKLLNVISGNKSILKLTSSFDKSVKFQ